jgi:hypothetical protein
MTLCYFYPLALFEVLPVTFTGSIIHLRRKLHRVGYTSANLSTLGWINHVHVPASMKRIVLFVLLSLGWNISIKGQNSLRGIVLLNGGLEFGAGMVALDDPSPEAKNTGGALYRSIPLGIEVGITDHAGIGIQYRKTEYKNNTDSVRANAGEVQLLFNYHLVTTKQTNSFIGIKTGWSDFKFEKTRNAAVFHKSGIALQMCGGVNMLFIKNMGMQVSLGVNSLLYPNGELINPGSGTVLPYAVYINGLDMGLGLFVIL